jgi:hypothetical protein
MTEIAIHARVIIVEDGLGSRVRGMRAVVPERREDGDVQQ